MGRWLRAFRRHLRRGPPDAEQAMGEALRRALEDDLDAVEELLARLARHDPGRSDVHLALARLYRRRGEIGRAIRVHQNLLLRRDLPERLRDEALGGLAADFRRGGFLQRAIASYEELLARHPRNRAALRAMVQLLCDARDFERALELARRLARVEGLDPRPVEAGIRVQAAEAAQAQGSLEAARKLLRQALRRDARNARGWARLGEVEAERGRTRRAVAAWRRALDLDRRLAHEVHPRLESAWAKLGRPEEFGSYLRGLLRERPGDAATRLALARTLAEGGATEEALAQIDQLLERSPDDLRAHVLRGRVLLEAGRDGEAAKAFGGLLDVLERRGLVAPPMEGLE